MQVLSRRGVRRDHPEGGFTIIEMLIAVGILIAVGGMVLAAFSRFKRSSNLETARTELQMEARVMMDEVANVIRQAGSGIGGDQTPILYAAPWELAINANLDDWQSFTTTLNSLIEGFAFPAFDDDKPTPDDLTCGDARQYYYCNMPAGNDTHRLVLPNPMESRAETLRIALDGEYTGNEEFVTDSSDKQSGSHRSVRNSQNPWDYPLLMFRYGCDATCGFTAACCGNRERNGQANFFGTVRAFTQAVGALRSDTNDTYPDGNLPAPLFSYFIAENRVAASLSVQGVARANAYAAADLNGDGDTADEFLWGDTDSDGILSQAELSVLYRDDGRRSIGLPVGSVTAVGPVALTDTRFSTWANSVPGATFNPLWLAGAISRVRITLTKESPVEVPFYHNPRRDPTPPDDLTGVAYRYIDEVLVQEVAIRVRLAVRSI